MAAIECRFRCMSPGCGHEYTAMFDKDHLEERQCPKCRSNSIWRLDPKVMKKLDPEVLKTLEEQKA